MITITHPTDLLSALDFCRGRIGSVIGYWYRGYVTLESHGGLLTVQHHGTLTTHIITLPAEGQLDQCTVELNALRGLFHGWKQGTGTVELRGTALHAVYQQTASELACHRQQKNNGNTTGRKNETSQCRIITEF